MQLTSRLTNEPQTFYRVLPMNLGEQGRREVRFENVQGFLDLHYTLFV